MKTRIFALLLTLALVLGLAACGASSTEASSPAEPSAAETVSDAAPAEEAEAEPAEAPAEEPAEEPAEAPAEPEPPASSEEETPDEMPDSVPANPLPLANGDVTLTMFASTNSNVTDQIGDLNNHQIYQEAQKITGVNIDIQMHTMETSSTDFNLMLASGDLTDLVRMGANAFPNGLAGALEQEQIIDVTEYLDSAPSYSYILSASEQINKDVRTDDGKVLGFYQIWAENGVYEIRMTRGPVMRMDLLDDLGVAPPTTYDELTEVLTAFKTEYDLSDPIFIGRTGFSDDGALIGGYDTTNTFYQVDGQVKYGPLDQGFEDYMIMMHDWYEKGILNRDFYSYEDNPNSPTNEALKYSGQAGMHYCAGTSLDNYNATPTTDDPDFLLKGVPLIPGKDGINHFGQDTFCVKPMGCMTISAGCKEPEIAVEWCDFWYSDTGRILSNYGLEGQTFVYGDDGKPHWTDQILNNPNGVSYIVARQIYLTLTQQPGIYDSTAELEQLSQNSLESMDIWNASADGAYEFSSCYSMTAEESEELSALLSDINTLNDENWIKFITGDKSLDEFDSYIDQLNSMNIARAVEIYQAALDRYFAR